jgi:hypothetical protein
MADKPRSLQTPPSIYETLKSASQKTAVRKRPPASRSVGLSDDGVDRARVQERPPQTPPLRIVLQETPVRAWEQAPGAEPATAPAPPSAVTNGTVQTTANGAQTESLELSERQVDQAVTRIVHGEPKAQPTITDLERDFMRELRERAPSAPESRSLEEAAPDASPADAGPATAPDASPADAGPAIAPDRSWIIENPSLTPDARAFHPASNDKSGKTTLSVRVANMPVGGTLRWSTPPQRPGELGRITLSDGAGGTAGIHFGNDVEILALDPGLIAIDVEVRDSSGVVGESVKYPISSPQFITIDEDAAAFDGVLTALGVATAKEPLVRTAKDTVDSLLANANVRTIWRVAPFAETVPAHVPAASVTAVTIRGEPPAGHPTRFGQTSPPMGPNVFNETIDVFPGAFDNPEPHGPEPGEVDTETQAIGIELASRAATDPDLVDFAMKVFGRLTGETIAHEITHALIGAGHTAAPVIDLHSDGRTRTFLQRTGLEDTAHTSPLRPSNFVDHGIAGILGLLPANQAIVDGFVPVPSVFK